MTQCSEENAKPQPPAEQPRDSDYLQIFLAEDREDRRKSFLAWSMAVLLHIPLIWVDFPIPLASATKSTEDPGARACVFRITSPRFRPPVPLPAEALAKSVAGPNAADYLRYASTGGNAEPNGAPYGDMFFKQYGTNPFIDSEDDPLSTFGLDVDTGSYTLTRRYLLDGFLPPPEAVRVEELVNYFDTGEPPPTAGDFAVYAEGSPSPYGPTDQYHLLRFHLRGRVVEAADRLPADLTFVIDVSGSMDYGNRLGLVKESLDLLLGELRPDDRVALVIYGSKGEVLLPPTPDHQKIRRAIFSLHTGGATNAEEGLMLAYGLASEHRREGAIHRLILCSDGVANVGNTSASSIWDRVREYAMQGIELTTVGFGMNNYNDVLMERLADTGNGRYAYVDSLDEARRLFVKDLTGTLQTIAAEARVQVEFNPKVVSRYRLLGYENRRIADQRFRDDTVDAGEIGAGHRITALYEIKFRRSSIRDRKRIATLHLRWSSAAAGEMVETHHTVRAADFADRWEDASRGLRFSSLVAELGEVLRESYWADQSDLDDVFSRLQGVAAEFPGDSEMSTLVSLAGRAAKLQAHPLAS